MLFNYLNLNNTAKLSIGISYKEEELVFVVKSLLDKTKKYNMDSRHQFEILESYLDYKGDSFKQELFEYYKNAYEATNSILDDPTIAFQLVMHKILDMFYIDDIKQHILTLDYIKPPANLKEKFDDTMIKDGIGTRVQTYTKDDYINLLTISVISKAIIAPFGEFLFSNPSTVILQTKELSLVQMILDVGHIFKSDPVNKLVGSFEKSINSMIDKVEKRTILLRKMISVDDLKWYLLGITLFKIMPVNMPRFDKVTINLITFIYSSTNDVLKPVNNIRQKVARSDGEEIESTLEIYRMSSDIMIAYTEEFKVFCEDPYSLLHFFKIEDKDNVLTDALAFMMPIRKSTNIDINIIKLMIWVISITPDDGTNEIGIIDPEAIFYLDLDRIVNLLAVVFTVVWYHGFKDVALLFSILKTNEEHDMINSTLGKEKIQNGTLEELKKLYPIEKEIIGKHGVVTTTDLISVSINDMVVSLYTHNYKYVATSKYLKGKSRSVDIPETLREQLAQLLISLHKGVNNETE